MADRWFSTPETGSDGKHKRSGKLCGGRRNSPGIELEIEACIGKARGRAKELVRDSSLDSCLEVRRELSISESGIGTVTETPTVTSRPAMAICAIGYAGPSTPSKLQMYCALATRAGAPRSKP
jgi:hypothetical protein